MISTDGRSGLLTNTRVNASRQDNVGERLMKLLGKGNRRAPLSINVPMKGRGDRGGMIAIHDLSRYPEASNLKFDAVDDNDDVNQRQKLPTNRSFSNLDDFGQDCLCVTHYSLIMLFTGSLC